MGDADLKLESETFLDRRLAAASRSDDPDILRNTITALVLLKGPSRWSTLVGLLADVIGRVSREGPGKSRYFPLLSHASEVLRPLDEEDQEALRAEIQRLDDPAMKVALLTLGPGVESSGASPLRRWLATRKMWPRFRFWQLTKAGAAAAALALAGMWLLLLGLAYATGTGAHPWGWGEVTALLSILAVATFSTALTGWLVAAGGAAAYGHRTLALDALFWGLAASLVATLILWLAPSDLAYFAWIRASAAAGATAEDGMIGFVLLAAPLLFVVAAGSRWLSSWLIERMRNWDRPRLTVVAAALPATVVTLLVMFGLGSVSALRGETIGIWLLVVTVAFASAAISSTIEMLPSRMQAMASGTSRQGPYTAWAGAALAALLIAVAARPALAEAQSNDRQRRIDIPLPGASIVAVEPNRRLEVRLDTATQGSVLLLVKNGGRFAVSPLNDRRLNLETRDRSIVICVLRVEDLTGGETSPQCERPSLSWIGDIFRAGTSLQNRASVSIHPPEQIAWEQWELGGLEHPQLAHSRGAAATFQIPRRSTLYVSHTGPRLPQGRRPEEQVFAIVEHLRADGFSDNYPFDRIVNAEGGYRICARRYVSLAATNRGSSLAVQQRIPDSYLRLSGTPCDSSLLREAQGVGLILVAIPAELSFDDFMQQQRPTRVRGNNVDLRVERPSLLLAHINDVDTMDDPILYVLRPPGRVVERADDPEEMVAYLEPGEYRLCFGELQADEPCGEAGLPGTLSYRLQPLHELERRGNQ